jgi:EAL domain-containing protein (putative c-di-GMP-specific phosphodiesterase class I)
MCEDLNIRIIAEGIETTSEKDVLTNYGITLFQGYLFCKPSFIAMGFVKMDFLILAIPFLITNFKDNSLF